MKTQITTIVLTTIIGIFGIFTELTLPYKIALIILIIASGLFTCMLAYQSNKDSLEIKRNLKNITIVSKPTDEIYKRIMESIGEELRNLYKYNELRMFGDEDPFIRIFVTYNYTNGDESQKDPTGLIAFTGRQIMELSFLNEKDLSKRLKEILLHEVTNLNNTFPNEIYHYEDFVPLVIYSFFVGYNGYSYGASINPTANDDIYFRFNIWRNDLELPEFTILKKELQDMYPNNILSFGGVIHKYIRQHYFQKHDSGIKNTGNNTIKYTIS